MRNLEFEEQENEKKDHYIKESSFSGKRYEEAELRYADLLNRKPKAFAVNPRAGRKMNGASFRMVESAEGTALALGSAEESESAVNDETAVLAASQSSQGREEIVRRYYVSKREPESGVQKVEPENGALGPACAESISAVSEDDEEKAAAFEEEKDVSPDGKESSIGGDEQKRIQIDRILDEAYECELTEPLEKKAWVLKIGTALLAALVLGVGVFALSKLWPEQTNVILAFMGIDWV